MEEHLSIFLLRQDAQQQLQVPPGMGGEVAGTVDLLALNLPHVLRHKQAGSEGGREGDNRGTHCEYVGLQDKERLQSFLTPHQCWRQWPQQELPGTLQEKKRESCYQLFKSGSWTSPHRAKAYGVESGSQPIERLEEGRVPGSTDGSPVQTQLEQAGVRLLLLVM